MRADVQDEFNRKLQQRLSASVWSTGCKSWYIGKDGMSVTRAFHDYAAPLVGPLPEYASLTIKRAKAR